VVPVFQAASTGAGHAIRHLQAGGSYWPVPHLLPRVAVAGSLFSTSIPPARVSVGWRHATTGAISDCYTTGQLTGGEFAAVGRPQRRRSSTATRLAVAGGDRFVVLGRTGEHRDFHSNGSASVRQYDRWGVRRLRQRRRRDERFWDAQVAAGRAARAQD
jgi:hypothetical protein